jgi:hypothetical protein
LQVKVVDGPQDENQFGDLSPYEAVAASGNNRPFCLRPLAWYPDIMTKLLDDALEVARHLPPKAQDDIVRVVLRLAGTDDEAPVSLTTEERAAIAVSKAAAARGELATEEQVRAMWARHGL